MAKSEYHNTICKFLFICFVLIQTIYCNHEKDLWEKSRKIDAIEVYRSYLNKYPIGTYQNDALIRIKFLREQAFTDNIFLNINKIYQTNWNLLKKPAAIVITINNENKYFLNQQEWDCGYLELELKNIYEYSNRKSKAVFIRIFNKSIDYRKIIDLFNMLKDIGVEEIIPIITPELEKILLDRFHLRIDLKEIKRIMKSSLPIIIPGGVELEPDDPDISEPIVDDEEEFEMKHSTPIILPKGKKLKLLKTGKIEYPELFPELAGLKKEIIIARIETDIYGRVSDVKILKCHPLLWDVREVIIHALKKEWIYDYFLSNGLPRRVVFVEKIMFSTIY